MANPTSMIGGVANLAAGTSEQSITLDPQREYSLGHNGVDSAGSADTNTIFLSLGSAVVASYAAGEDKFPLLSGSSVIVGPGVSVIRFKTASGAPTFRIAAGARLSQRIFGA